MRCLEGASNCCQILCTRSKRQCCSDGRAGYACPDRRHGTGSGSLLLVSNPALYAECSRFRRHRSRHERNRELQRRGQSGRSKIWLCAWGKQYLGHSVEHSTLSFGRRKLLQRDHHRLRPFVSVSGCRLPRQRDGGRIATNNAEREGCCAA